MDWVNWKQTPTERLPIIMVFGPHFTPKNRKLFSGKMSVLQQRELLKYYGMEKLTREFSPKRILLEEAIVHGKAKPTFREGHLGAFIKQDNLKFTQPKLFEIRMSKKEFYWVCRRIEAKLLRYGYSLESFERERREAVNAGPMNKGKEQILWQVALAVSGKKQLQFTKETISLLPLDYLFTLEASRLMTNKLVKRGLLWVKRNIPED